jgi:internalin A
MTHAAIERIETALASGAVELDLSNQGLESLPDPLRKLQGLEKLLLSGNNLDLLPDWITELTGLKELDLSGNRFSQIPEVLRNLQSLHSLSVVENIISSLPPWLSELKNLDTFRLGIYSSSDLTVLSALSSRLTDLYLDSQSFNGLIAKGLIFPRLIRLQLRSIGISEPNNLTGQLPSLIKLSVFGNLRILPEWIVQLSQLQELAVSNNQLSALPESLGQLSRLQGIDLAFNALSRLPRSLIHLTLEELWLQGNLRLGFDPALLGPYVEPNERYSDNKIRVAPSAILEAYFAALDRDGKPLSEIKLVLVGRGAAGKTSIVRRLVKGKFSRNVKETQGIEISRWILPCNELDVTLNIWDFAGQVITHSTHQFFLSENSVYVLVLTGREDTQKTDADYWLRLIRAFTAEGDGNASPVIIALNKWDETPFKLDRNLLREKYPFIVDFIETDCKSGLGMEALEEQLAKTVGDMAIIRQPFKLSWWKIKEKLEKDQLKKHYFPYSEFQSICAKQGESDPARQLMLTKVFHALGIALNYGSDARLRSTTVLTPRWVTENIYKLLRVAVPDNGTAELTLARVREVLPNEPETMQRYLVELMRRFDLAFPLNEAGDRWLVPQRLPDEQPILGSEWIENPKVTRLRYRYPVILEGLLPRFITRTYPLSEGADETEEPLPRWTNGVVLEDRSARALVRVFSEDREIQVIVIGERYARLSLLGVIQADFRTIHNDIQGLDPIEELEVESRPGIYVPVQTLRADEAERKDSSASTPQGTYTFKPTPELNRLSEPEARDERQWRAKIFISYSTSDARLKDQLLVRLKPMRESAGLVEWWHDRFITPGEDWDGEIKTELEKADEILLLVSAQFLASRYIRDVEMKRAIERANNGEALLIPIVLENCGWRNEQFGKFNALPRKGTPIRDAKPQRNAWYAVEEELRDVFKKLSNERAVKFRSGNVFIS